MTSLLAHPWSAGPIALFLDVDGTLTPLMPRPEDVRIAPGVLDSLGRLFAHLDGALALVSGRPLDQLDALVAPLRLPAAGVHGGQRRDASGQLHLQAADPPAPVLAVAQRWVERHPALRLEPKPSAFALHFRARPELGAACSGALRAALGAHPDWEAIDGHCVVEVRRRGVHKGLAIESFLNEAPFAGRLPVFVGDDVTDEDGFAVVEPRGGLGVKVGAGPSRARARLDDPAAVGQWLGRWAAAR